MNELTIFNLKTSLISNVKKHFIGYRKYLLFTRVIQVMFVGLVSGKLESSKRLFFFVPNVFEFLKDAPNHDAVAVLGFAFVDANQLGRAVVGRRNELGHGGLGGVRDFGTG